MAERSQIDALIHLLDDPDKEVFNHVSEKIKSYGLNIIPSLEEVWENTKDTQLQQRIELLIENIQFGYFSEGLHNWAITENSDLMKGVMLLSRYQNPDFDEYEFERKIADMRREIWIELNYNLTALEQVNVFNHVFYSLIGFKELNVEDETLQHFNIQKVLETKVGNQISLGILYIILAHQVEIPVYGVNLPENFVLGYNKRFVSEEELAETNDQDILFYINPANKGSVFTRNEISEYLKKMKHSVDRACYCLCPNLVIVQELISNLMERYKEIGNKVKARELRMMLEILEELI